jgi:hypothetical protein
MSHNRIPVVCLVLSALTASAFIATQLPARTRPLALGLQMKHVDQLWF